MVADGRIADVVERAACALVGVRSGSIASHAYDADWFQYEKPW